MTTGKATDDVIDGLSRDLEPVRRLRSPAERMAIWSVAVAGYVAVLVIAMASLAGPTATWPATFWISQVLAVATGVLSSAVAFASVVPGASNRWRPVAIAVALIWLLTLVVASPGAVDWAAAAAASHEWFCVAVILGGGAPPMLFLVAMLRRGAPIAPAATAGFSALAVVALMNVAACLALPHTNGAATLAWHGGVLLAAVVSASLCGRRLFFWRAGRA